MGINIKNIKGDVVISEKQTGGFTGKITSKYDFFNKHKKSIMISVIILIVTLVGFISNLTTILDFFKIQYF